MALAPGPGTAPTARTTWRSCSRSSRASLGGTFHQDGRCIYADDRTAICLIHETGTAPGGDRFDNLAVYTSVFARTGKRTGSGPLTSTPSTVKTSGRKTLAHPQKTFPSSYGAPVPDASFLAGAHALGPARPVPGHDDASAYRRSCKASQIRRALLAPRSASPQAVAPLLIPLLRARRASGGGVGACHGVGTDEHDRGVVLSQEFKPARSLLGCPRVTVSSPY